MVDSDLSVWLIECNTNPCLNESSIFLRDLLPRMIDDTLRLTVDKEFASPNQEKMRILMDLTDNNFVRCQQNNSKRNTFISRKLTSIEGAADDQFNPQEVQDLAIQTNLRCLKEKQSVFKLDGYSDSENLWQKLMAVETGKTKLNPNIGVNQRVIRAKNMVYISPYSNEASLTDYQSYKYFFNSGNNGISR
jgi:hypothetical protein